MEFEFDARKSAANRAKHGIDFVAAQAIWADPQRLEVPARWVGEPRWLVLGQIDTVLWTATVTYRHENRIRLISVRHPRRREVAHYHAPRP